MKGIAGNQTRGLQNGSRLNVIDNTGAKVIEIITVPGYHGVARRSPKAALGDIVIASVKKGTPAMRRQIRKAATPSLTSSPAPRALPASFR